MIFRVDVTSYKAHRLAWLYIYGEWPSDQIDHINHIRTDNRIKNLRDASSYENSKNQSIPKNNTSGVLGVGWNKLGRKWRSNISVNGKRLHLGCFDYFIVACAVRKEAELEYEYHENHGCNTD